MTVNQNAMLTAGTKALLDASVPYNTRRAFSSDQRCWTAFMSGRGKASLPASAEDLADYVTLLLEYGSPVAEPSRPLSVATVERRLTAVRAWAKECGFPPPDVGLARCALVGHQRTTAVPPPRQAAPVTISALRAMIAQSHANDPDPSFRGHRDRGLLLAGWGLAARRSELVGIRLEDLQLVTEGALVRLRRLKTTTTMQELALPWATDPLLCPVRALLAVRQDLQALGHDRGPLFRSISRAGVPGGQLSPGSVTRLVAALATDAGLPVPPGFAGWSAHGLRRGLVCEARRAGADSWAISRHGCWAPGSKSLAVYISDVDAWEQSPLKDLL